jgi:hypothetical protein
MKIFSYFEFIHESQHWLDPTDPFRVLEGYEVKRKVGKTRLSGENFVLTLYQKGESEPLANASCSLVEGVEPKVVVHSIVSLQKGRGYGKILMLYLAKRYGYNNIETPVLTKDGEKMMSELDRVFGPREQTSIGSKHLSKNIITRLAEQSPLDSQYLDNLVEYGEEATNSTWDGYLNSSSGPILNWNPELLYLISTWIEGSATNTHKANEEPPAKIYSLVDSLFK